MATNVGAKKRAGIVLMVAGVIILVVALLPNAAGIPSEGLTPARVTGIALGALVGLVGLVLTRKQGHTSEPPA